jgi:hypothetical protein
MKALISVPVEEIPPYLYHATYRKHMYSITEYGLGGNVQTHYWKDSLDGVIYLSSDMFVAESYAETSELADEDEPIVILKIDPSTIDHSKLFYDRNVIDSQQLFEYHGIIDNGKFVITRFEVIPRKTPLFNVVF